MENIKFNNYTTHPLQNQVPLTLSYKNQFSEEDFERLLDEFISEQTNDETKKGEYTPKENEDGGEWKGFDEKEYIEEDREESENQNPDEDSTDMPLPSPSEKKYQLKKVGEGKFWIPELPHSFCQADKLIVQTLRYEEQSLQGEPLVYLWEENAFHTMTLHLENLQRKSAGHPMVYIYDLHRPEAVRQKYFEIEAEERHAECNLTALLADLPLGNYFLLIQGVEIHAAESNYLKIENGYCLPLAIVANDHRTSIPQLRKAEIQLKRNFHQGDINFFFDQKLDELVAFTLFLYDSDYHLIARSATFVGDQFGKRRKKNLHAHFSTEFPIFGNYTLYLLLNGQPFKKIAWCTDRNRITSLDIQEIPIYGKEYLLLTELEECRNWHKFRESYMGRNVKEYFLSRYPMRRFNHMRRYQSMSTMGMVHHVIYEGGYSTNEINQVRQLCRITCDTSQFDAIDGLSLAENENQSNHPSFNDRTDLFNAYNDKCWALYNLSALLGCSGTVHKIIEALQSRRLEMLCLMGSAGEIQHFLETYPKLKGHFPPENRWKKDDMQADALLTYLMKKLKDSDLFPTIDAQKKLMKNLREAQLTDSLRHWTFDDADQFIEKHIVAPFIQRVLTHMNTERSKDRHFLSAIEAEDIHETTLRNGPTEEFEESIRELKKMVGLKSVKKNIITTFHHIKNKMERRNWGLKTQEGECHHMIFTGNPGTGKTTVAKMVGRIYRSLGILSKGEVICTERSKLVGNFIGDTERNMQQLLAEARGNVLFVDEAYTLCDSLQNRKDFGYRVIECLLTVMAQENSDLLVIFAGYSKEMDTMMQSNQGLNGRFPYKFEFEDYTASELTQIAEMKLAEGDYLLSKDAHQLLQSSIEEVVAQKKWDFSNARWVNQYVNNGIIPAQSERLALMQRTKTREDYQTIEAEDIQKAYARFRSTPPTEKTYRPIGFTA